MTVSTRKGSALLVVLGMLSFMVVSAVAFSAYMRSSRLPSSFLRRTVSSRLLVKAALAEAIDEIDASIGNNPHPGVGAQPYKYPRYNGSLANRNKWIGRVYIGGSDTTDNVYDEMVDFEDTVSTLCLEGLAYIPPPIVNEARYYSRRSNAAVWKPMEFDAGRYAYCAIDVSDYFDVNQIYADVPRSSSAIGRVSLAYLFEDEHHTRFNGNLGTPDAWDEFMEKYRNEWTDHLKAKKSTEIPLVSLADWNLALWDKKPGNWQSPFCNFVENNGANFYGIGDPDGPEADKIRRMCFVTDGLFPAGDASDPDADYDLSDPNNQPFDGSFLNAKNKTLGDVVFKQNKVTSRLLESICPLGYAQLCDYLDPDRVPISLGVPTTERVPMISGIQPLLSGSQIQIVSKDEDSYDPATAGAGITERTFTRTRTFRIDGAAFAAGVMAARLKTLLVYPFRHKDGLNDSFDVDGRLSFFFTKVNSDIGLKVSSSKSDLRLAAKPELSNPELVNGVLAIPFNKKTVPFTEEIKDEVNAVKEVNLEPISPNVVAQILNDKVFLRLVFQGKQTRKELPNGGMTAWIPSEDEIASDVQNLVPGSVLSDILPLDVNGEVSSDNIEDLIKGGGTKTYNLNAAVCIRERFRDPDLGEKTVDLVPASIQDDQLNGMNVSVAVTAFKDPMGNAFPVLRLDTGVQLELSVAPKVVNDQSAVALAPKSMIVFDPRYNNAPECWCQFNGDLTAENWLSECHARDADRDGDIFMMVSDQGYLQSIYELANLPRLTDFYKGTSYSTPQAGPKWKCPQTQYTKSTIPSDKSEVVNYDLMWRTYNPFPNRTGYEVKGASVTGRKELDGDDFEGAGFTSAGNGPKINPYSDCTNVIMAAFANTPHDWRCASTNDPAAFEEKTAEQFNKDYAWNQYSSGAKMNWEDLEDLAACFMKSVRDHAREHAGNRAKFEDNGNGVSESIEEAWRHLASNGSDFQEGGKGWFVQGQTPEDAQKMLCGLDLAGDRLYNSDKKFLYGYWRDCFAAKQQLFLVFVRAEPTMMGSGSANQMPPQLGARAVALVWRDPRITKEDNDPHKTRILFYRQFD